MRGACDIVALLLTARSCAGASLLGILVTVLLIMVVSLLNEAIGAAEEALALL